jgi:hypothetical protein
VAGIGSASLARAGWTLGVPNHVAARFHRYKRDFIKRVAALVDKILKDARPGGLLIEQPTLVESVINQDRQDARPRHPALGAGPGGSRDSVGHTVAELPDCFIIVRRDNPMLYQHLRESYEADGRVNVIVDRRATSTAVPPEVNERQGERRGRDRRATATGDRRQARRRQPLASPQHDFWMTEGFVMVRRVTDTST